MTHYTLNVCQNRGNSRVWLEGSKLESAGIFRGMEYIKLFRPDNNLLTLDFATRDGDRKSRVAGTDSRPIIDICSKAITDFMGEATHYQVSIVSGAGKHNFPVIHICADI